MIEKEHALVVDIDGTLCAIKQPGESYADVVPEPELIARLRELSADGWRIILQTARGMRSHDGNPGQIIKGVSPTLIAWLDHHDVPYDELHMAKPWPGHHGYYIDDRAVRPREFLTNNFEALDAICDRDRVAKPIIQEDIKT